MIVPCSFQHFRLLSNQQRIPHASGPGKLAGPFSRGDSRMRGAVRVTMAIVTGVLLGCVRSGVAHAQLDTQTLIGSSVTEIGTKYQDIDQAITRFKNRDIQGARHLLERAKQRHPELAPVNILLAKMYFAANQARSGMGILEQAVLEDPQDPEAYLLMASLSFNEGRTTAADALFHKGVALLGSFKGNEKRKRNLHLRAFNGLARISERRKQWDQAAKLLTQLAKEQPEDAGYIQRLGIALFMQGKGEYAEKAFQRARQLDAKLARPEVTEARLDHQQGKDAEAKKLFEKAIAADTKDAGSRLAYAQWLLEVHQPDEAKRQLAAVLAQDPHSLDGLLLAGLTATIQHEYAAAEKYLESAHLIAPANASILNRLALALVAQDDDAKRRRAGDFASLGAAQYPNNGNLSATLGWIYYKLGRTVEAEQRLNAAIKTRALSPDSRYLIAQIFFDRGRNVPAKQLLEPVVATRGIFVYRPEAKGLLDRLQK